MAGFDKELFTRNLDVLRKSFKIDADGLRAMGAMMYTAQGKLADRSRLEMCYAILKSQKGIFSEFRDNMRIPVIVKMSLADDPEAFLNKLNKAYDIISSNFIFGAYERVMAAIVLCDNCTDSNLDSTAYKTIEIYEQMRSNHPWLTSQADMTFAVLTATENKSPAAELADVEECYNLLKDNFVFSKDALQTVSHILAINKAPARQKVDRFMSFFKGFKDNGFRLTGMYMPILAILANSDMTVEDALRITKENDQFLKKQKGFNIFGVSGGERRMMAAAVTAIDRLTTGSQAEATIAATVLNLIIQIEMMIIVMVVMASVSASSASH